MKHLLALLALWPIWFCTIMPKQEDTRTLQQENWITVLVHGIIGLKPYLNIPNVVKFVRDNVADSVYSRTVEITRKDSFFYQYHPMQPIGLLPIDCSCIQQGKAASAFARSLQKVYEFSYENPPNNTYYTFGWSGLLSPQIRYLEAKILYNLLSALLEEYPQDKRPKIRIIGYSHGGNVALKLAEVFEEQKNKRTMTINELILVGIPIISETDYLVNHSMFEHIYHFYSYGDRVQRLDWFSLHRFFSNRIFRERSDFKLPDKLVQINLRVKRPAQNNKKIIPHYDNTTTVINTPKLRSADPGHTELWSFGWSPTSYRQTFPLYPLPTAVFIPHFINTLHKTMPQAKHVSLELHPASHLILAYDYYEKKSCSVSFLSEQQQQYLKDLVLPYKPTSITKQDFDEHINKAKSQARHEYQASKKNKVKT